MSAEGWDSHATTPTASAAVSRSPTLVDLPSHNNLDSTVEAISKAKEKEFEEEAEPSHHSHHHHLPHLNLPPHPHQHLEQYYPPENYESLDEIERERREAEKGTAPEKGATEAEKGGSKEASAAAVDDFPDGGLRASL